MLFISKFLKRAPAAGPIATPDPAAAARAAREEKRERAMIRELYATRRWARSTVFESKSINLVALVLQAPFGYKGDIATIDIRGSGEVKAQVKSEDGDVRVLKPTDEEALMLLRVALRSVNAEGRIARGADAQSLLTSARDVEVKEHLRREIEKRIPEENDLTV